MIKLLIICQKVDLDDDILGFFHGWIKEISVHFEKISVITLYKGRVDLPSHVEVYSLGKEEKTSKLIQGLRFYKYAAELLPKSDGIFVHMAPEYVKALYPINIFFRKPIVMWYAHIKVSPTALWALDHVSYVLTPSKVSFGYDSPKVIATGHGIDTEVFSNTFNITPKKHSIVTVSRISKVKRIEVLIEALNILVNELNISDVTVNIYGKPARIEDGEYEKSLKEKINTYGLDSHVIWHGGLTNRETPNVYVQNEVFVRMQGGGGFGKTELEAMSLGVPAITPTPVYKEDLEEFFEDLYYPEDDAHELAKHIEKVFSWDANKKSAYAKKSTAIVAQKHNLKNVAKQIHSFLVKAINKATI